jgi:dihydrofolate reductase
MALSMEGEMPGMPKLTEYVFSRTLNEVRKGSILIKDDVKEKVLDIKSQPGKDIWLFGGASLTSSLMNDGLVDEISLAVHPVLLGEGKSLFNDIKHRVLLKLQDLERYANGLVMLTYQVSGRQNDY